MLAIYLAGYAIALALEEFGTVLPYSRANATLYRRNLNSVGIEPMLGGGFSTTVDYNMRRDLLWRIFCWAPIGALLSWIDVALATYRMLVIRGLKPIRDATPASVREAGWKLNATAMTPDEVREALRQIYGASVEIFISDGAAALDLAEEQHSAKALGTR